MTRARLKAVYGMCRLLARLELARYDDLLGDREYGDLLYLMNVYWMNVYDK